MEAIIFFFVGEQIAVKEGNALSRCPKCRNVHDFRRVEVCDEFVSVGSHFLNVCVELGFCLPNGAQ